MAEQSISLEETNRIRISLGLIPIPVAASVAEDVSTPKGDAISVDETNRLRMSLGLKPLTEPAATKSTGLSSEQYQGVQQAKSRDEKLREALSSMKSKMTRKRKVNAGRTLLDDEEEDDWLENIGKRAETSAKSDQSKKVKDTTGDSLKGVKVAHSLSSMGTLDSAILTLKDTNILEEEDQLESEVLAAQTRLQKEMEHKLGTNKFTSEGVQRTRLQMMMNEGETEEGFMLEDDIIKMDVEKDVVDNEVIKEQNKVLFTLSEDDDEQEIHDDYAKAKPIKMKKLKKQQAKGSRKRRAKTDEDGEVVLRNVTLMNEDTFQDDDVELQERLSRRRLEKQKKRRRMTPEDLVREIEEDNDAKMDVEQPQGVVIGESTEFLSSLRVDLLKSDLLATETHTKTENPGEIIVHDDHEPKEEAQDDQDDAHEDQSGPNFSGGLASTLSFLRSKNVIHAKSPQVLEQERENKKLKQEMAQRVLSGGEKLVQDGAMESKLANYKPQVSLKYHDEYGRELNQKEAYKQLSHHFHGKAPNQSKLVKKKKLVAEERRREQGERLLDEEREANPGLRIQ